MLTMYSFFKRIFLGLATFLLAESTVAATYNPIDSASLIAAINAANLSAESDTIDLGGLSITLSAIDNITDGSNGLPSVANSAIAGQLLIRNGVVERDIFSPSFRLLHLSSGAALSLDNVTLRNGLSLGASGGAILVQTGASLQSVNNSSFENNTAGASGGAISLVGDDSLIGGISNSTFTDNTAVGSGGAINLGADSQVILIANSTFDDNNAANGGAIALIGAELVTLTNSTITRNNALVDAGGVLLGIGSSISNLTSNIVAENFAQLTAEDISNFGVISNASFNLVGSPLGHTIINGVNNNQVGTLLLPLDPMLGALQNNGGLTETRAILSGSPALNEGDNPQNLSYDQRGVPFFRVVGAAADVGAFEAQDADGDDVPDAADNCPFAANPDQTDTDDDGIGNACDSCPADEEAPPANDTDADGICNAADRCPGFDDAADADNDGLADDCDNCADNANNNQQDTDHDGIGDACDNCTDVDADGVGDVGFINTGCTYPALFDNCRFAANPPIAPSLLQLDTDSDGLGNACDACPADAGVDNDDDEDGICNAADRCEGFNDAIDSDSDNIPDGCDNCPDDANHDQTDVNANGIGDVCDLVGATDSDDDGIFDFVDNCPAVFNPLQADDDEDTIGDACDNCPDDTNFEQEDSDFDGEGDACDTCTDIDGDGFGDAAFENNTCADDNCRFIPNPAIAPSITQLDTDGDGIGNACDTCPADAAPADDSDTDGICNAADRCPGEDDAADGDNDSWPDECDNCPLITNVSQLDTDQDGIGDACDECTDQDDDTICDEEDNCPFEANTDQADGDDDDHGDACDKLIDLELIRPEPPLPLPLPLPLEAGVPAVVPETLLEAPKDEAKEVEEAPVEEEAIVKAPKATEHILKPAKAPATSRSKAKSEESSGCSMVNSSGQSANNMLLILFLALGTMRMFRARRN